MAGIGPMTQDWDPVVVRKKAPNSAAKKDEKAVNAARRAGAEIETLRIGIGPMTQDWEPVVVRKKAPNSAAKKDEKAVNAARRAGAGIETLRKAAGGSNKAASSGTSLNTRKLDEETENLTHDRVPTELKKAIMQARQDKKLTQSQLAQLINEKPQIIQEYESGKAHSKSADHRKTGACSWSETAWEEVD